MNTNWNWSRERTILAVILAIAVGLRFWGIWFGLPYLYAVDEHHEVFRALELGTGSFNFERVGKGGYFYILFVEYGVLFVALMVAGVVDSAHEFARYFARDPSAFYLIGRATTAAIGALNVFVLYRLGSRSYSIGAGLLAALFLSVDFLHARESHYITVDILMTCLATVALLFAVRMATEGRPRDYKLAALFAALATTTKIPAMLLIVPLLAAHIYYVRRRREGVRQLFLAQNLWWAVGIFLLVLAVTNPGLFLSLPVQVFSPSVEGIDTDMGDQVFADGELVSGRNLWFFYLGVLRESMGLPLFFVSAIGVAYAFWRRTAPDVILGSFGLVYFIVFASTSSPDLYYPRYMLPVVVVLAVFGGRFLARVWPKGSATRICAAIVVASLVFLPAYQTVVNNYRMSQKDTRTVAKEWIESNIPPGARVFIEGLKIEPTRLTVPLQDSAENIRANIEYYKTREPGKAKYLRYRLEVLSGKTYDLVLVSPREVENVDHYKQLGVEYMIIRPDAFVHSRKLGSAGKEFVDALRADEEISLLTTVESHLYKRPGPNIEIYRVDSNAVQSERR